MASTEENLRLQLAEAKRKIERLEENVECLESEIDELKDISDSEVDDLIRFLQTTERDYPTPELYKRDLDELVRAADAGR